MSNQLVIDGSGFQGGSGGGRSYRRSSRKKRGMSKKQKADMKKKSAKLKQCEAVLSQFGISQAAFNLNVDALDPVGRQTAVTQYKSLGGVKAVLKEFGVLNYGSTRKGQRSHRLKTVNWAQHVQADGAAPIAAVTNTAASTGTTGTTSSGRTYVRPFAVMPGATQVVASTNFQ